MLVAVPVIFWLQLPEITLGIVPGIGGMVVPYRRWPAAAQTFHDMLRLGNKLDVKAASELGIVDELADSYEDLIKRSVAMVGSLRDNLQQITDDPVSIPSFEKAELRTSNGQLLSPTIIGIVEKTVTEAATASSLEAALEIGYRGFGASACTEAAKEGIESFLNRRQPDFGKTG